MVQVPSLQVWCQQSHAEQLAIQSTWCVADGDGQALASAVARQLTPLLDRAAGEVFAKPAWNCWMMAFRTPLLFDRATLPITSPPESIVACYMGFSLRPWIAGSDWPLPRIDRSDPFGYADRVREMVSGRLAEFREVVQLPRLTLDEAVRRFHGNGFWIDHQR